MSPSVHHFPRLFCGQTLSMGIGLALSDDQSHYLRNVLRKTIGDQVRLFNEVNGEWLARISAETKKLTTVTIEEQIRVPILDPSELHLIFSPIKKDRNDMIIEKAVELGATHLHPVLFARTIVRDIKAERIHAQMIEAAEQCERLSIPRLSPLKDLKKIFSEWDQGVPVFAGIERTGSMPLSDAISQHSSPANALLIGPEGGITPEEIEWLGSKNVVRPTNFGPNILRAETAVFYGLSLLSAARKI